jgi:hypothetical protein
MGAHDRASAQRRHRALTGRRVQERSIRSSRSVIRSITWSAPMSRAGIAV